MTSARTDVAIVVSAQSPGAWDFVPFVYRWPARTGFDRPLVRQHARGRCGIRGGRDRRAVAAFDRALPPGFPPLARLRRHESPAAAAASGLRTSHRKPCPGATGHAACSSVRTSPPARDLPGRSARSAPTGATATPFTTPLNCNQLRFRATPSPPRAPTDAPQLRPWPASRPVAASFADRNTADSGPTPLSRPNPIACPRLAVPSLADRCRRATARERPGKPSKPLARGPGPHWPKNFAAHQWAWVDFTVALLTRTNEKSCRHPAARQTTGPTAPAVDGLAEY